MVYNRRTKFKLYRTIKSYENAWLETVGGTYIKPQCNNNLIKNQHFSF